MNEDNLKWLLIGVIGTILVLSFGGLGMMGFGGFSTMMGGYLNPFTLFLSIMVQIILIAVPIIIIIYFFKLVFDKKELSKSGVGKKK